MGVLRARSIARAAGSSSRCCWFLRVAYAAQSCGTTMGRGPKWTEEEDQELVRLVRACGHQWSLVAARWTRSDRSERALAQRYASVYGTMALSDVASTVSSDGVLDLHAQAHEVKASRALLQAAPSATCSAGAYTVDISPRARRQEVCYVKLQAVQSSRLARTEWLGRGWDRTLYCITRRYERPSGKFLHRELLTEHRWLAGALQLHKTATGQAILYCDMARAHARWLLQLRRAGKARSRKEGEAIMRSTVLSVAERDAMGLVQYPATKLPTFLASGARRAWIGGSQGGFYAPEEAYFRWLGLAAMMESGRQTWGCVEQVLTTPSAQMAAVGDSLALTFAVSAVTAAHTLLLGGIPAVATYGSLYSGAFDAFLGALRWAGRNLGFGGHVHARFAAESDAARRQVLARLYAPAVLYRSAMRAATQACGELTFLSWTPPCTPHSAALNWRGSGAGRKGSAAVTSLTAMRWAVLALLRCMRRTRPEVVLGEQVSGLFTHRKASLWLLLSLLEGEPYKWFLAQADAAELGACFHRRRLLLLGIREDRLASDWESAVEAASALGRAVARGQRRKVAAARLRDIAKLWRRRRFRLTPRG